MINRMCALILLTTLCLSGCSTKSVEEQHQGEPNTIPSEPITDAYYGSYQSQDDVIAIATQLIKEKKYPQAMSLLSSVDYDETAILLEELRYRVNGSYICAGISTIAALNAEDRKAITLSNNAHKPTHWGELPSLKSVNLSGLDTLDALSIDGEFITTSMETVEQLRSSQNAPMIRMADLIDEVNNWSNIYELQIDWAQSAIALFEDGTVHAAYPFEEALFIGLVEGWEGIVSVYDGHNFFIGLKEDGTLNSWNCRYDISDWSDIVALDCHGGIIGLKGDGTVLFAGEEMLGKRNVSAWDDIIAVSTSTFTSLGLKRDGTVVAVGDNRYGQMDVSEWVDIVAIDCNDYISIGLKADGTMVIAGDTSQSGIATPNASLLSGLFVPVISIRVEK